MRLLWKINRGLILTVLVIIAVATCLTVQAVSFNSAKPEIQEICKDYIKTVTDYAMLPSQYRTDKPNITQAALDTYLAHMNDAIETFYSTNTQASKYVVSSMKVSLKNQANGTGVVYSYKKEIRTVESMNFNENSVTVTMLVNTSYDGPNSASVAGERIAASAQTTDTITLQKSDGKWNIVSANLQLPTNNDNQGAMTTADTIMG